MTPASRRSAMTSYQGTGEGGAQYADKGFLLAGTDAQAEGHHGIGFFLVDMKQPGVEVRRIKQMTGGGEFCEIFLTGAEVEEKDIVGDPGAGWKIAMRVFGLAPGVIAHAARA